jgi:hypothetical protein
LIHADPYCVRFDRLKTLSLDGDCVPVGDQLSSGIVSRRIGQYLKARSFIDVGYCNLRAGYRGAAGIGDGTNDVSENLLSMNRAQGSKKERQSEQELSMLTEHTNPPQDVALKSGKTEPGV